MAGGRKVPLNTPKNGLESSEHYRKNAFGFSAIMTDLARTRTHHEFLQMNPWLIGAAMKRLSSLQSAKIGGRDRDRTCDLMLAKHALSQLSYTPTVGVPFILKHSRRFQNPFLRFSVME